jgi:hypothetical protein
MSLNADYLCGTEALLDAMINNTAVVSPCIRREAFLSRDDSRRLAEGHLQMLLKQIKGACRVRSSILRQLEIPNPDIRALIEADSKHMHQAPEGDTANPKVISIHLLQSIHT